MADALIDGCPIVEFRRYRMVPGRRDELIDLFERKFVETQEQVGITVIGTFRDAGDPDRFVWLRGFADMAARRRALGAFYGGPVWARHRVAANATMLDSDDNLLLQPAWPGVGFRGLRLDRPAPAAAGAGGAPGAIIATVIYLERIVDEGTMRRIGARAAEVFQRHGLEVVATLVTEPSPNDVPALPIREGISVVIWLASAIDAGVDATRARDAVAADPAWLQVFNDDDGPTLAGPAEYLILEPTTRSRLRG